MTLERKSMKVNQSEGVGDVMIKSLWGGWGCD